MNLFGGENRPKLNLELTISLFKWLYLKLWDDDEYYGSQILYYSGKQKQKKIDNPILGILMVLRKSTGIIVCKCKKKMKSNSF